MITVCFWLSVTILLGSAVYSQMLSAQKKYGGTLNPTSVLFVGVLVASFVLYFPAYFQQEAGDPFQVLKTFLFTANTAMDTFGGGGDYGLIKNTIDGDLQYAYSLLAALLMLLAPVLTLAVVMSFFSNILATFRYILAYFRDVYIFTELNEQSLTLAKDLFDQDNNRALVFTDVPVSDDAAEKLRNQAKKLGAILFPKDALSIRFHIHDVAKSIYFFAMGQDESANLEHALRLVRAYGNRENTHLYVLSTDTEGEVLLTSSGHRAMKVRRVDPVQSLIYRNLHDRGQVLFDHARPGEDGVKNISAVVIGMGKHGTAMMKALTWYCQMDGYRVRIDGFDRDNSAEDRFCAQCPELMDPRYNGVYVDGEAQYYIRIHGGVNTDTKTFTDRIHSLDDATYVLVALGDDRQNIQTALRLRMLFEQCGAKPVIQAIVMSSDKRRALKDLKNYRGQPYHIDFIGDLESSYTQDVIINSELEKEALRRHLRWGDEAEFWSYEYNYRSSMALAVHARAKLQCGMPGADKTEEELRTLLQERDRLEKLEHRRWNAYMRSEGYIYSGSPDKSSRNDLGKMHHDLVNFEDLTEEEKRKDSQVGSA